MLYTLKFTQYCMSNRLKKKSENPSWVLLGPLGNMETAQQKAYLRGPTETELTDTMCQYRD